MTGVIGLSPGGEHIGKGIFEFQSHDLSQKVIVKAEKLRGIARKSFATRH